MTYGQEQRNKENLDLVKGVFSDAYRFYIKYHGTQMGPEAWEEAIQDMDLIVQRYHGKRICVELMLAAVGQLERETK